MLITTNKKVRDDFDLFRKSPLEGLSSNAPPAIPIPQQNRKLLSDFNYAEECDNEESKEEMKEEVKSEESE